MRTASKRRIDEVVSFAATTSWDDVPRATQSHIKALIVDSLAVLSAGYAAVGCKQILELVAEWQTPRGASVLGSSLKVPPPEAAMLNATLAEAWDFDDTHDASIVHCLSPVFYAALAAAEWASEPTSGREFLGAVAAGLEILPRLGMACTSPLSWTRTATLGGIGGAFAAARVAGVPREALLDAAGIAYMQSAGNSQTILDAATAKKLQVGFAARGAVLGAQLAKKGLTGPHDILEGRYGYFELYERGNHHLDTTLDGLGTRWEIDNISVKPFPSARETHAAILAAFDAAGAQRFNSAEIDHVIVRGPRINRDLCGRGTEGEGARAVVGAHLSIPYTVAVVLLEGQLRLRDFTASAIAQSERQSLAAKVDVRVDEELPANDLAPVELEISLKTGKVLCGRCASLPAGLASARDDSLLERKQRSCAEMAPAPSLTQRLANVAVFLEHAENETQFAARLIERFNDDSHPDIQESAG